MQHCLLPSGEPCSPASQLWGTSTVWFGTVPYEPRTECFYSSKGQPCCLDKKRRANWGSAQPQARLVGILPSLGCGGPQRPVWAHLWTRTHICTCGVFLRELLFPGSGWSAGASAGQTNRKRLPSLCLVNPGIPDTLQPGIPARHSHEQAPTTLGATFLQFLPNKNRQESPEGTHRNRGEHHRGPGPLPPAMVHSLPHFLCPPVKGWSWVTSASHGHLAQGKPTFQNQHLYLFQLPAPKQVGLFRKTQRTLGPGFKTLHPV